MAFYLILKCNIINYILLADYGNYRCDWLAESACVSNENPYSEALSRTVKYCLLWSSDVNYIPQPELRGLTVGLRLSEIRMKSVIWS